MSTSTSSLSPGPDAREVVVLFIAALNDENFALAREQVHEDMTFHGVLGTRNGAEAYFEDMKRMRLKYNILKTFAEGDDVCLLYDIDMGGKKVYSCGWYQVRDGKIASFRVVFDPRPVLEGKPG